LNPPLISLSVKETWQGEDELQIRRLAMRAPVVAKFIQCIGDQIKRLKAGAFRKNYGKYGPYNEEEKLGILLC
jgi:hypothetical protein